jgi:hypothetical protein
LLRGHGKDFTEAGKICATKGLHNESVGLACYEALGLTHECAKVRLSLRSTGEKRRGVVLDGG